MLKPPYERYEKLYIYGFREGHRELKNFEEPDLIGYWEEDGLGVLFFHQSKDELVDKLCKKYGLVLEIKDVVHYSQWNEGRVVKPFEVGPFKIAPLWFEGTWDILFDPSIVFGEGTHPTTSLMLEHSYEFFKERGLPSKVLDIGCGSGILTLFWAKLGAPVCAMDINPLCVKVTSKNLQLNNLTAEIYEADVRNWQDFSFELILANLYKGLLLDLFKRKEFLAGKFYIISGFTVGMEEEIREGLKEKLKILKRKEKDVWVSYLLCQI